MTSSRPDAIRVRHLVKGLGPGGAERLIVAQAAHPAAGTTHSVDYLLAHKDHLVGTLEQAGVTVKRLPGGRLGWLRQWRRRLIDEPVDVVHGHSPALSALARVAVRSVPRDVRPVIVGTEHNQWPRHHRLTRAANRLTLRLEARTIAVSDDVARTVRGARDRQLQTVVHGIDLAAVRAGADRPAVREELHIGADDVLVVCVANFRTEKALDHLVAAATAALAVAPQLRYVLIGQGPLATEIDRWVDQAQISERFTVLGYRDDATRIMSGADLVTLSSRHEGLPVVVMEALALGIPIAATAAGGTAAAVGNAGVITPVGDVSALAAAHIDLVDPTRRAELARHAPTEAERFSVRRANDEIAEIYRAAVDVSNVGN